MKPARKKQSSAIVHQLGAQLHQRNEDRMKPARKKQSSAITQQPAAQLYRRFVDGIKERIRTAQIKTVLAANAELVLHYWEVGHDILSSQQR